LDLFARFFAPDLKDFFTDFVTLTGSIDETDETEDSDSED